jgi:4-hydroxy-tetrahydrodipicolinate synthase
MLTRAKAMALSAFVVSLTPFKSDGELDEDEVRGHFRRLAAAGIGVYVGGTGTGEGATLSVDETRRLYEIAREELKGKVPVRAMGVEPRTAGEMIELARLAADTNLDAMQIYSIAAPGATPAELEDYFDDVLSVVRIPAVISIHHAVGYTIPLDLVKRLVTQFDHVVGVNCTKADLRLLDLVGAEVAVHVADVTQILNNLVLGGHGFLTNDANLVPRLCVSIIAYFEAGDFRRANEAFATLIRVHDENAKFLAFKGTKAALNLLGLPGGYPRSPRHPLSAGEISQIGEALQRLDIPSIEGLVAPTRPAHP